MPIHLRFLLFLMLLSVNGFSQSIKGRVLDDQGRGLPQVTVKLEWERISRLLATDREGSFDFGELSGARQVRLSAHLLGYASVDTLVGHPFAKIVLRMQPSAITLKDVTITKQRDRISVRSDRLIFNMENDPNFNGNNGLEALSKVPLVSVDKGLVQIVGKSAGAGIMVDGKLMRMDAQGISAFLSSLNAANISKVEVITQPSAEFEAGSVGGLINIVTKQQKAPGLYASALTNYTRTSYDGINQGISLNYNVKKLMLYANMAYSKGASGSRGIEQRELLTGRFLGEDRGKTQSSWLRGNIAAEYPLSKRGTLGLSFNWADSRPDMVSDRVQRLYAGGSGTLDSAVSVHDSNEISFRNLMFNLHLSHTLGAGGKLTSDFDFFSNEFDNLHSTLNVVSEPDGSVRAVADPYYLSGRLLSTRGFSWSVDVSAPLKKWTTSYGAKLTRLDNRNLARLSLGANEAALESIYDDMFQFTELTGALYATGSRKMGKFEMKLGLRAEATGTRGESDGGAGTHSNSYVSLFPSVYLTYQSSEVNSVTVSYARKIGRPNFSSLNPARIYSNRFDFSMGNPELQPYFTHSFQVTNTYRSMLVSYLSFEMYGDRADGIQLYDPGSNRIYTFFGNFLFSRTLYLDNTLMLKSFNWIQHSLGVGLSYNWNRSDAPGAGLVNEGFGADLRSINSFGLNKAKTVNGGVTFRYSFPTPAGLSTFERYYSLDLSANALLFKKKFTVSATVFDVFDTKNIPVSYSINGVDVRRTFNNDTRRLVLAVVYSFGNNKISRAKGYNGSAAEQSRGTM